MIWDSLPWKRGLLEYGNRVRAWQHELPGLNDEALYHIERETFLAFYAMRKLSEAQKIPAEALKKLVPLLKHPLKAAAPPVYKD